ncbi:NAD-dependent epimerase/dehydratase family protein [Chlorobium sp. BLA1]|uniref:NAD-dependent epimerase/dehydratase family protein n=1 Tax=Candidatus Chlorobium masyuteum TaxID=2716876 RepID=UPI00141D869B|nr:NAD(P)-dependent oxidoreductase [Candidatus Chlorobium masyuteum]NHQ59182.1 NAD-dependent epimerase/dehydratase family protein [Candidatus Chlorobium masyuteum]
MSRIWVIGSHGLLGQALCWNHTRNGNVLFVPNERFNWGDEKILLCQITSAVKAFSVFVSESDKWEIYWAAGIGSMNSLACDLNTETRALERLLHQIELDERLIRKTGAIAFSSSAGSIYAASQDFIINENSAVTPTTDYAQVKIAQEQIISEFTNRNQCITSLLARLSTLYGAHQSFGKRQGLLTHIARCILKKQPIKIYVPLDTIRDYIAVDDAALIMIHSLRAIKDPISSIKIIASEQPTTIANIISSFKSITRHAPQIVNSVSELSFVYSRRMTFRSIVYPDFNRFITTNLFVGISRIFASELAAIKKCNN